MASLIRHRIDSAYGGNQALFARAMEISPQSVTAMLKGGVTLPHTDVRRRLAKELGVPHIKFFIMAGELTEEEANLPDDPRTPAVRRLQPVIDQVAWTDGLLRRVEESIEFIRDAQRGMLTPPTPSWEMENTEGIKITEFGEDGMPK